MYTRKKKFKYLYFLSLELFSVTKYTREAGVRQLERNIGAICRAIALKVAEGSVEDLRDAKRYFVDQKIVEEVLGVRNSN